MNINEYWMSKTFWQLKEGKQENCKSQWKQNFFLVNAFKDKRLNVGIYFLPTLTYRILLDFKIDY